jgi:uncharacterized membrane protein YgcG
VILSNNNRGSNLIRFLILLSLVTAGVFAQGTAAPAGGGGRGSVQGTVKDATGGIVRGAEVTLSNESGTVQTVTSGAEGTYAFHNVATGNYTVSATFKGLQQANASIVSVTPLQTASANITLVPATQKEVVNVNDSATNSISTEATNNQNAIVLSKEDIDALPDDPDDLQADLQALAGPSAGPGGSQIYVDGFTGGRLPPKESIREIRINSNPFSAEFDKLGYGRIQIFTKPGSDKFHGQAYYNISDGVWNSRNPFLPQAPPFRTQLFGGNVSGPIGKKASFFIDAERRMIDDNDIVNATIPTADFTSSFLQQSYYSTPQRRTTVSPRLDYALGTNHTLSIRYSYLDNQRLLAFGGPTSLPQTALGDFTLPSTGYTSAGTDHSFQIVETSVLSPKAINETHLNIERDYTNVTSQSNGPTLSVAQSFVAGGSGQTAQGFSSNYDHEKQVELQNYTSLTLGQHTVKAGIRIRSYVFNDTTPSNFNGSYSFLGSNNVNYSDIAGLPGASTLTPRANGLVSLTSIQQFLFTEQFLLAGRQLPTGLGPTKYSVTTGNPNFSFYQLDYGPFLQDDWKVRPNLTMSFGLRYEAQNDIPTHNSWAPRFGFAWSPGAKASSNSRPKTVVRGGWGMFYDRFSTSGVENALRYSGAGVLQTYTVNSPVVTSPNFFTTPLASLQTANLTTASSKYQLDSNLQAPRLMQIAVGVDRQIFNRTSLSVNFVNSRGNHELRTVDINSPLPVNGLYPLQIEQACAANKVANCPIVRPYSFNGDIYDYQSSGTFKQTQLLVNVNTQIGKWGSLFGRYSISSAHSDTDGLGSIPSNPFNFAQDWGRSSLDITNNFFLGGSLTAKWGLRFSPFIVAHTGSPYNVTTGTDLYLQNSQTARPGFLGDSNPTPGLGASQFLAALNPQPALGSAVVPRNYLTGPGFLGINLRVSKTFGFGTTKFSGPSGGSHGGGGGGGRGGFGGGGGFGGRGGGNETTQHRYNITVSLNARNILNHENLNSPTGVMTSPYFLESTGIQGGYGAEGTSSNQRRIDLQLRFAF